MSDLLSLVEKLSFVRTGGSAEEEKAAVWLSEQIKLAGGGPVLIPFSIPDARVHRLKLEAMGRQIPAFAYTRTGNLSGTFAFRYLERGEDMDFLDTDDLTGTVVMVDRINEKVYKRLLEHRAAAFISIAGRYYDPSEAASVFYNRPMRPLLLRHGVMPGFQIHARDAAMLVQQDCKQVTLDFQEESIDKESRNVLACIPGSDGGKETVVLTAHYDSVPVGTGAWDNATGSALLLGLFRHFIGNRPRRNLQFIWCGSEELGLLGSKAYIAQHEQGLADICFCFNFDMCGTALGNNNIVVTGDKQLETFARQYCKRVGYSADITCKVHSSDSAPFCDRGIPALGLGRGTRTAEIHTYRDLSAPLSAAAMDKNLSFACGMVGEIANARVVPVEKGMSDEIKKELDTYFGRDKD